MVVNMLKEQEIIEKLEKSATEILNLSDFVKVVEVPSNALEYRLLNSNKFIDLSIQVETKEKEKYLILFEVKSTGQPRYARMRCS